MNKSQISYIESRVAIIKKRLHSLLTEKKPELPELSTEERVSQIVNGIATFKVEKFAGNKCPYNADKLFSFFEFVGDDEIQGINAKTSKVFENYFKKIAKACQRLSDDFVLERYKDIPKVFEDFEITWEKKIEEFVKKQALPNVPIEEEL